MTKQLIYVYLGTDGRTIESPVHLEGIYSVRKVRIFSAPGKILTNGNEYRSVVSCSEADADNWREVDYPVNLG